MATVDITMKDMENLLMENDIIFIDFWAEWCGPCKMFGPVYEKISEKYPDIMFAKCDTENQQDLAAAFDIQSIPTIAIFREKILLFKQAGSINEKSLEDLIDQVSRLDMDDVRRQIDSQQASEN